jgi:hypothetical protein
LEVFAFELQDRKSSTENPQWASRTISLVSLSLETSIGPMAIQIQMGIVNDTWRQADK